MHFQTAESGGPRQAVRTQAKASGPSTALPFGQSVQLSYLAGPSYSTAQTLVQQVAFVLSDKVFTYSPESFDLDISLNQWKDQGEKNGFGERTGISCQDTRAGAGSIALGYIFSKDFDLQKRHHPQSIIASAGSVKELRASLDQLSLLYDVASPLVAHVAAADYVSSPTPKLSANYVTSMESADELGLSLISSTSTYEAQHMALLSTLMSKFMPTIHTYDGVFVGRETARVADVMDRSGLFHVYKAISHDLSDSSLKHTDPQGKVLRLLQTFNDEFGTEYQPFEYYGHPEPTTVVVGFGSVEASLGSQLAFSLGNSGARVGFVNVRVYRPFIEDSFLQILPRSVRKIIVLGQVERTAQAGDPAERSKLYEDVLAAITLASRFRVAPSIVDYKYPIAQTWTPSVMLAIMDDVSTLQEQPLSGLLPDGANACLLDQSVFQYVFWDTDDSRLSTTPAALAKLFSAASTQSVTLRTAYDNLTRGGITRTDLRCSTQTIEAPYSATAASIAYVGDENLLKDIDILNSLKQHGTVLVRLPDAQTQDMEKIEKRLPASFRLGVAQKEARLYLLDPNASKHVVENPLLENILLQNTFLQISSAETRSSGRVSPDNDADDQQASSGTTEELQSEEVLRHIELPESWFSADLKAHANEAPRDIETNSFQPFDKEEEEQVSFLKSWKTAAKGMMFKEATAAKTSLRPELGTKTYTVHVKEHRRLTPKTYDRNIFHIELDLGTSGLTYNIGEALGIHAENDKAQVEEFIQWYDLNSEDVVEVPAREDSMMLENRTVYQALMQNIDLFGRPPKRFYETLAEYAANEAQKHQLLALGGPEGAQEFKRRAEVDTVTYVDILKEFPSAHPTLDELVRMVNPMKRREYSIASSQKVTPDSVSLLVVTVGWVDPNGRDRFGQATHYLDELPIGAPVTVSVKPSVMKLPTKTTQPIIMAGLGTGLAPFRAFVQERAWQKQQGYDIGSVLLYMGSRHQREEYLYGEEWEAYQDAGIITLLGRAFSRDQPQKVYIQDRMRQTMNAIQKAYLHEEGSFYLCGPTWPVPDVTGVLQEAVSEDAKVAGRKVDSRKEIEKLKDDARYVLEVY